jgi:hypothetical protein
MAKDSDTQIRMMIASSIHEAFTLAKQDEEKHKLREAY